MKIYIKIHPSSSQEKIVRINEYKYEVWIKEKPIEGKANAELVKILKKHFKKEVKIIHGIKSREKVVEVE